MQLLVNRLENSIVPGDAPFIGTFTFGEQGHIPSIGNVHGNLVNSMIVIMFTEKEE